MVGINLIREYQHDDTRNRRLNMRNPGIQNSKNVYIFGQCSYVKFREIFI